MPDSNPTSRGLLDTSALIDFERIDPDLLPQEFAISTLTLAELAAGPHATTHRDTVARRIDRLQRTESQFEALPFDGRAARAHGRIAGAVLEAGRKPRGARAIDLLIAATALANDLPLFTRNAVDLVGLEHLVEIHAV